MKRRELERKRLAQRKRAEKTGERPMAHKQDATPSLGTADYSALLANPQLGQVQRQAMIQRIGDLHGNQFLSSLLQQKALQRDETESADEESTLAFSGKCTEFGDFNIYADDFVGPLPTNDRDAGPWAIRQTQFTSLMMHLKTVKEASGNITINGSADFKARVLLDLGWLMTSSPGQALIRDIAASSHDLTFEETADGNSEAAANFENGMVTTDTPPKPGPGTDVTVYFNPNKLHIKDGTEDWHKRPPAIAMSHELVHAWADMYGTTPRGKTDGVPNYEMQAVGLGNEYKNAIISENKFRVAFGLPERPVY